MSKDSFSSELRKGITEHIGFAEGNSAFAQGFSECRSRFIQLIDAIEEDMRDQTTDEDRINFLASKDLSLTKWFGAKDIAFLGFPYDDGKPFDLRLAIDELMQEGKKAERILESSRVISKPGAVLTVTEHKLSMHGKDLLSVKEEE